MNTTSLPDSVSKLIEARITSVEAHPVLLDRDLAELHGLSVVALREIVQEHIDHFPGELCFQPEASIPGVAREDRRNAFTEQGVWMTAALLDSASARKLTIEIARAFERYRQRMRSVRPSSSRYTTDD